MAYRQPGVKVTQVFLLAQPALAAAALPNVNVGKAYQLITEDLLGTYSGNQQAYSYASLAAGGIVDLEKENPDEVYPITKRPITVVIKDALIRVADEVGSGFGQASNLQLFRDDSAGAFDDVAVGDLLKISEQTGLTIVAAQTNGVSGTTNPERLTEGSAGDFDNVKAGDSVVVTGGSNTNTGTFNVITNLNNGTIVLDGSVNDGGGAASDVAYSITGDRGAANAGNYRVKAKNSANELELESPLSEAEAPITYLVDREVSEISVPRVDALTSAGFVADENGITIPSGLQYSGFDIVEGNVEADYRGLRTDLASTVRDFTDLTELYALYGGSDQITPANPLGFASSIALQNSVSATNALGLSATAATNEVLAYGEAYDVLETTEMYAINVLTQNPIVHQSLKSHVEQLSLPDNKLERIGLINRTLITEEELKEQDTTSGELTGARVVINTQVDGEAVDTADTTFTDQTVDAFLNVEAGDTLTIVSGPSGVVTGDFKILSKADNNNVTTDNPVVTSGTLAGITYFIKRKDGIASNGQNFYDRDATFFGDGIAAGDILRVTAATSALAVGDHKIIAIVSDKEVQVEQIPGITSLIDLVEYEVVREMTKTQQAEAIKGYSESIGSRRVVHVWPDVLEASVGNSLEDVPGFYAGSAVGALITGLPSQQGFTNLTLSGFLGFQHSTRYFKESQLNIIADGGTFILGQEAAGQALFVRHQLTTDRSTIQFQELSITKNVDFAAKFIRDNYKSFIGEYNIVDTTLDDLKTRAKGILTFLRETTRQPKIGGVIRGGNLSKLAESETQPDTVLITFRCNFPFPLNNIDITLEVE